MRKVITMKRLLILAVAVAIASFAAGAKTLVVYYSFTGNVQNIVGNLSAQIDADVIRIEPAEKGLDYAANGYAIGSALISAIRNNPNDASSYPAIDPVSVNMEEYDVVIVATPLWWSNMAAPMQSFLFRYGSQMSGKYVGLIVSSASSGISGVVADAKRLVPNGSFLKTNLWIRSSQVSGSRSMIANWLNEVEYNSLVSGVSVINEEKRAEVYVTSESVNVDGDFDVLTVFDAGGRKILSTSRKNTPYTFSQGCYVVQLKKGDEVWSRKVIVR